MATSARAVDLDLEHFHSIIHQDGLAESTYQRFLESNPYYLGLAPFQFHPKPRLERPNGQPVFPDFLVRRLIDGRIGPPSGIIELKLPTAQLLAGRSQRRRLSGEVNEAMAQAIEYGKLSGLVEVDRASPFLPHSEGDPKLRVVMGLARNEDPEALLYWRSRNPDIQFQGYDEIFESVVKRFASQISQSHRLLI